MHTVSDREMAIPRMFDSNTPFVIVTGGSEISFLSKEDNSQRHEEEKDSLVQAIAPHLSRVMQHGTAKHVVTEGDKVCEENPCVSIVAQAESKCGSMTATLWGSGKHFQCYLFIYLFYFSGYLGLCSLDLKISVWTVI